MKINRKELEKAVKMASKVVNGKSNMPILSAVIIDGERQCMEGTDLEMYLHYDLEISDYVRDNKSEEIPSEFQVQENLSELSGPQLKNLAEDYGITVPVKGKVGEIREAIAEACVKADAQESKVFEKFCMSCSGLQKILATIEDEVVEIREAEADVSLIGNSPRVRIGENFHSLIAFNPDEFPALPEAPDVKYDTRVSMKKADLENVVVAAAGKEDSGFVLNVVHFDLDGEVMLATDGHRMHIAKLHTCEKGGMTEVTLPAGAVKMVKVMADADGLVHLGYGGGNFRCTDRGKASVQIRAVDSSFPDYKQVMPNPENQKTVTLEKEALEKPLHQAATLVDNHYAGFKVKFNGGIDLETVNPERGTWAKTSIPILSKSYGDEEVEMGLNTRFVLDAIKPIDSKEMDIRFESHARPITVTHGNFTALVMPMRV